MSHAESPAFLRYVRLTLSPLFRPSPVALLNAYFFGGLPCFVTPLSPLLLAFFQRDVDLRAKESVRKSISPFLALEGGGGAERGGGEKMPNAWLHGVWSMRPRRQSLAAEVASTTEICTCTWLP